MIFLSLAKMCLNVLSDTTRVIASPMIAYVDVKNLCESKHEFVKSKTTERGRAEKEMVRIQPILHVT